MMDYLNPNEHWYRHYDPYKGMSDHERAMATIVNVAAVIIGAIISILLCTLL